MLAALLRAHADGMDVVVTDNYPLFIWAGVALDAGYGWTTNAAAVVADRLAASVTIVVAAAGDHGDAGAFD